MTNTEIILDAVDAPNNIFTRTAVRGVMAATYVPVRIATRRSLKKLNADIVKSIQDDQDEINRRGHA